MGVWCSQKKKIHTPHAKGGRKNDAIFVAILIQRVKLKVYCEKRSSAPASSSILKIRFSSIVSSLSPGLEVEQFLRGVLHIVLVSLFHHLLRSSWALEQLGGRRVALQVSLRSTPYKVALVSIEMTGRGGV